MKLARLLAVLGILPLALALSEPSRSGLDTASFDRTVAPQDDLYRYVNGGWLARTAMPGERVTYGAFAEIAEATDAQLHAIIEELAARPFRPRGSPEQQIVDLYASLMDEGRLAQLGAAAIGPELRKIDAIQTPRDLAAEAGYLSSIAAGGPFAGTTGADPANRGAPVARITQGGILLPDREYYLSGDAAFSTIRAKYHAYLVRIFQLTDRAQPEDDARTVLALETALATAQWPQAQSRDLATTYTRFTLRQLATEMPGFDWAAWARPQGLDRSPVVILAQPSFFKAFAALVPEVPLETWKAWLAARYITASAPYLSKPFEEARFDFFGRVLTGQQVPLARWRRGVSLVNGYLGDALGQLYVRKHFPTEARTRVQKLLSTIVEAYRDAIRDCEWMSPGTRREALDKLSALSTGVGYPERWRDYRGLTIAADDLVGNIQRSVVFEGRRTAGIVGLSGGEWLLPPQTVNAYYSAAGNEIVLPAAVFQPPVFNLGADDAVNYGAAGALIGHEISHAFDNRGRRFDGSGAVHDWWTAEDERRYAERGRRLANQFDAYAPLPGLHVNGSLTVDENLGDLAGLSIAWRAYILSLRSGRAPVIDGLSGAQRFFMGWAQMWRSSERDDYLREALLSNPYAPSPYRANGIVSNIDAFYEAFAVKPGNRLYRDPSDRVKIW